EALDFLAHERRFCAAAFCFAVFAAFLVLALKHPFSFIIDTLFAPLAFFALLVDADENLRRRLATLTHVELALNAIIAIGELLGGWRLTPFYVGGEAIGWDWRSTALLGHPLVNALLAGLYLTILASGATRLSAALLAPAILLQLVALAAFGGRAGAFVAIVILLAFMF